jgi:hypothetical protein
MTTDSRTPEPLSERPKVVYVMGTARSGSTILGVTLGNCDRIFYAGELGGWLVKSGISWLAGSERERFWSIVRDQVDGAEELFGRQAHDCLEVSLALFRIRSWPARRRLRKHYRRVSEQLYLAIARESGATHIVDTSSHPLRARELRGLSEIDLYLVYLVRDPESVVASFTRSDVARFSRSAVITNAYVWLTNLLCSLVFLSHPRDRRIFVRYEDFVADPECVVRHIVDQVDGPAGPPDFTALRTGIPFQGNRLLREGEAIAFKRDTGPPPRWSCVTTLFQLPWKVVFSRLRPAVGKSMSRETPGSRDGCNPAAREGSSGDAKARRTGDAPKG